MAAGRKAGTIVSDKGNHGKYCDTQSTRNPIPVHCTRDTIEIRSTMDDVTKDMDRDRAPNEAENSLYIIPVCEKENHIPRPDVSVVKITEIKHRLLQ